jgi:hypothetical protein
MVQLKYLSGGQNKNIYSGIKFCSETGPDTLIFHVLPALEHHTYSEDDVEEGRIKIKKFFLFLMKFSVLFLFVFLVHA